MAHLSFERHCAEIVAQTGLLSACTEGADMTAPGPSCPGWNLGQLLRHLGGGHRWAEATVRTRATRPLPDDDFRDLAPDINEDPADLGPWLTGGATQRAGTRTSPSTPWTSGWNSARAQCISRRTPG